MKCYDKLHPMLKRKKFDPKSWRQDKYDTKATRVCVLYVRSNNNTPTTPKRAHSWALDRPCVCVLRAVVVVCKQKQRNISHCEGTTLANVDLY